MEAGRIIIVFRLRILLSVGPMSTGLDRRVGGRRPPHTKTRYLKNKSFAIIKNIAAIAKGMSITFMEMFQPTTVENYPDGPGPLRGAKFQERFRGVHVLQRDENGLEKCVACFLCAANCPANCIYIEAAENTAEHRVSGAERYAKVYNIDYNRCIFCGYCVEACPTDAITHGHGFELATFNATNLIYRKEQLLAARPAHLGANPVFNTAEVIGGAPAEVASGE
jgi:NADH-quinone oxidoreductase subunit I